MKLLTAGLTSTILATGLVGSVAAYRSQVGQAETVERPTQVQTARAAGSEPPRTIVRWAPCPGTSRLEKGVCVTDVTRTVVVPAVSAAGPAPSSDAGGGGGDDEVRGEVRGEDHGSDDHGEDHGADQSEADDDRDGDDDHEADHDGEDAEHTEEQDEDHEDHEEQDEQDED